MLVAEDGSVDLGLCWVFEQIDLLFRFGRHVRLKRLDIFSDAGFHALKQTYPISVFSVPVFFSHCHPLLSSRSGGGPPPPGPAKIGSFPFPAEKLPPPLNLSAAPSPPRSTSRQTPPHCPQQPPPHVRAP